MLDICRTVLPARNPDFSAVEMPPLLLDPRVRADLDPADYFLLNRSGADKHNGGYGAVSGGYRPSAGSAPWSALAMFRLG
jgi:hypothetical protein